MSSEIAQAAAGGAVESKGLKSGALGLASATVVGVASTAPGYSLAASLGFVTAAASASRRRRSCGSRSSRWRASPPAFFYLNRADPDCGTNFTLGHALAWAPLPAGSAAGAA